MYYTRTLTFTEKKLTTLKAVQRQPPKSSFETKINLKENNLNFEVRVYLKSQAVCQAAKPLAPIP